MKVQVFYISLLVAVSLILSACGDIEAVKKKDANATESPNQSSTYANSQFNLIVHQAPGWQLNEEKVENDKLIASFKHDNVNAIITIVPTDKNFKELKDEFLLGAGEVEIITNNKNQLSYKSTLGNSIRTDIFLAKKKDYTYIYTLMTPNRDYQKTKEDIDNFIKNIEVKRSGSDD